MHGYGLDLCQSHAAAGCHVLSDDKGNKGVAWERTKAESIMWWAANAQAYGEFDMGMSAFNTKKITGTANVDVIKLRQMIAKGHPYDEELFEAVLGRPKE